MAAAQPTTAVNAALATALPHAVDSATTTAKPPRAPLRMRHPNYAEGDVVESSDSDREATDSEGETTAVDDGTYQDDNYVRKVLAKERPLPPITLKTLPQNINVISTLALTVVPALAIYGAFTTQIRWQTALWSVIYYFYTGLGALPSRSGDVPSSCQNAPLTRWMIRNDHRYHRRVPQAVGSPILHRVAPAAVLPRPGRLRRRRGCVLRLSTPSAPAWLSALCRTSH